MAGSPQFTHASWNDFRILRDLLAGKEASTSGRLVPWAVFTTPELGHVGLTEAQARAAGHEVLVARTPTAAVPRARTLGRTEGFYKVVIDADTDEILGAAVIGPEASEVVMGEGLNIVLDSLG